MFSAPSCENPVTFGENPVTFGENPVTFAYVNPCAATLFFFSTRFHKNQRAGEPLGAVPSQFEHGETHAPRCPGGPRSGPRVQRRRPTRWKAGNVWKPGPQGRPLAARFRPCAAGRPDTRAGCRTGQEREPVGMAAKNSTGPVSHTRPPHGLAGASFLYRPAETVHCHTLKTWGHT